MLDLWLAHRGFTLGELWSSIFREELLNNGPMGSQYLNDRVSWDSAHMTWGSHAVSLTFRPIKRKIRDHATVTRTNIQIRSQVAILDYY